MGSYFDTSKKNYGGGVCNTPYMCSRWYRAPELLLGSRFYTHSVDVWAVGTIIFEMLTRIALFVGEQEAYQIVEMSQVLGCPDKQMIEKI